MFFSLIFNLRNNSVRNDKIIIQTLKRTTTPRKRMEACKFLYRERSFMHKAYSTAQEAYCKEQETYWAEVTIFIYKYIRVWALGEKIMNLIYVSHT